MNNIIETRKLRKSLRAKRTDEEKILWFILKDRNIFYYKFRRQHSIGKYILDFYCPELKLCIELDGKYHFEEYQIEKDLERDSKLRNAGIFTIRIVNSEIRNNLKEVIQKIRDVIINLPKRETYEHPLIKKKFTSPTD